MVLQRQRRMHFPLMRVCLPMAQIRTAHRREKADHTALARDYRPSAHYIQANIRERLNIMRDRGEHGARRH